MSSMLSVVPDRLFWPSDHVRLKLILNVLVFPKYTFPWNLPQTQRSQSWFIATWVSFHDPGTGRGIPPLKTVPGESGIFSSLFAFLVVVTLIPIMCQAKQGAVDKGDQLLKVHKPFTLQHPRHYWPFCGLFVVGGDCLVQRRMLSNVPSLSTH